LNTTYILGIEEPEQNLHPHAQINLLKNLRHKNLQVIFTTHSPSLIDELTHEEVILCRRIKNSDRGIEVSTTQLNPKFWEKHGINKSKYYQFYFRKIQSFSSQTSSSSQKVQLIQPLLNIY